MVRFLAALGALLMLPGMIRAQAVPARAVSGQAIALQLVQSLQSLQTAMAGLDPDQLHVASREKAAITDGQGSVARNLAQAMPGLLSAFRSAPENLGSAFRLYQDAEAVVAVAQRSAGVLPARDDDAGGAALRSSAASVRASLDALGSWIETRGGADYTARQSACATNSVPAAAAAAPPPATLVINDANSTAKPAAKKAVPTKKKAVPTIPHS
ncbi:MAG: hypothetical protein ACRD1C_00945 [Terriglobales bacterium]